MIKLLTVISIEEYCENRVRKQSRSCDYWVEFYYEHVALLRQESREEYVKRYKTTLSFSENIFLSEFSLSLPYYIYLRTKFQILLIKIAKMIFYNFSNLIRIIVAQFVFMNMKLAVKSNIVYRIQAIRIERGAAKIIRTIFVTMVKMTMVMVMNKMKSVSFLWFATI